MARAGGRFTLVLLGLWLLLLPTVRGRNMLDCGGSSRLATAESLAERGSFVINDSSLGYSCDRMRIGNDYYSDKPPLLSVAAAGVYALLHHGLGLDFDPRADPNRNTLKDPTYYLMSALFSALAVACVGALVEREARRRGLTPGRALVLAALSVFGTLLWAQSTLFSSHTVAAALLLAGLLARGPAAAGALLGLTLAVDMPLGALALALRGLALLACDRRALLRFGLAACLPLTVHLALNVAVVGDPMPFQTHRELYDETTGHTGESASGFEREAPWWLYLLRNSLGSLGVFALTPVLLPALLGGWRLWRGGGADARLGREALLLFGALLALYTLVYPNVVGCSYGMRHLAPLMPPLLLAGSLGLGRARGGLRRVWLLTALLSVLLAGGGVLVPTTCSGFVADRRALVPARVFGAAVEDGLLWRLRGRPGAADWDRTRDQRQ